MKYYYAGLSLLLYSCSPEQTEQQTNKEKEVNPAEFTVEQAPEWSDLFLRSSGWFGGDGIFAIPFSGIDSKESDSLIFLFSDTMIGEIAEGKLQQGSVMVNNSVGILKDKNPDKALLTFKMAEENKVFKSVFVPQSVQPDKDTYFWLGDGFANPELQNDLFVFAYKITNTHDNSDFPFKETGNSLIRIPAKSVFPYKDQLQKELPFNDYVSGKETVSFGAGVFNNSETAGEADGDGFLYVYGIKGIDKKLVAARINPADIEQFGQWKFWDGNSWSGEVETAAALSDSVSNEMSVSKLGENQYALVYQLGGIFPEICLQVGPTPVGPFGPRIILYKTSNDIQDPDLFTYNAKAHPSLASERELLISYNVNSFRFFEVIGNKPNLYRPRFIRVKFR